MSVGGLNVNDLVVPDKFERLGVASGHVKVDQIRQNLESCASDLELVSGRMAGIQSQGGWERFWHKGRNIMEIAQFVGLSARAQRKSLDLVVLLMGAASIMKHDYNTIIESIEDLSKNYSANVEVLEYLVKLKNTVTELKNRDDIVDSLVDYTNALRDSLDEVARSLQSDIAVLKNEIDSTCSEQAMLKSALRDIEGRMESIDSRLGELGDALKLAPNRRTSTKWLTAWMDTLAAKLGFGRPRQEK